MAYSPLTAANERVYRATKALQEPLDTALHELVCYPLSKRL